MNRQWEDATILTIWIWGEVHFMNLIIYIKRKCKIVINVIAYYKSFGFVLRINNFLVFRHKQRIFYKEKVQTQCILWKCGL